MVSGPNLNETSIVSGGYGGAAEGIIPTSSIKGTVALALCALTKHRGAVILIYKALLT